MNRRDFIHHLAGLYGALPLLSACVEKAPLRLGIHPWIGYETIYLARDFGWLSRDSVLVEGRSAGDSLKAMREGLLEAGCLTLDEVLLARADGIPLAIVAILDVSAGADVLMARPEMRHLPAIKGKRIGIERSALGELMLTTALDAAGLARADVQVRDVPPDRQLAAWRAGQIDVAVTYEPTASMLERDGAVRLFDSRQAPETIIDVLAVHRDRMRGRRPQLRALLAAHFRGLEHLRVNRQDALHRIASREGVSYEEAKRSLAGVTLPNLAHNRTYMSRDARIGQTARKLNRLMVEHSLLKAPDRLENLFDQTYLPDGP